MEKIKFITDSSSDMPPSEAAEYGVELVPVDIVIDGKAYKESVDFTPEEFYEILDKQKNIPTSSAINPHDWYEVFARISPEGFDRFVVITVGKALSSNYSNAVSAKEYFFSQHPEYVGKLEIDVYDSGSASIAYSYVIQECIRRLQNSVSYSEIRDFLNDWFRSFEILFVTYSFEVAKKSGRINNAAAYVGEKLNFRPILVNIEGKFIPVTKVRGDQKVAPKFIELFHERARTGTPFIFMNGSHPTISDELNSLLLKEFGRPYAYYTRSGPAMVINAGHRMFCVGYLNKERRVIAED